MERQQFNKLVQVLQNNTVFQNKGNKPQAPVEFQLVIFLRRLGSKDDILSIYSRFGICEGWPGSMHDARVYANSDFFLNKAKYIEGDDYVLSDSAYPISFFLITPFKNPFNHRQRQFNFIHSKHRVVVEHAFGRLKARFKALKELSVKDIKTAIKLADCAILLHNFLEICGKIWEINDQNDDDDDNYNDQYDWEDESDEILKLEGELKRERMLNQYVA
ncbi:unnamed protein product [Rhizophagus irregularis]|uniref:DDE Tnp4 domain-containing protein n=2 Tax=Rhizophagus irregularis TaxID=588596 RepID=A0A916ECB1_9GLOM|nr:unnamed protein product [Rhizophagus irregularis]